MYWSKGQFHIFGFNSVDTRPSLSVLLERVHPSDRPVLEQAIAHAIRYNEKYTHDYRIIFPDGSIKVLHSIGQPFIKPEGGIEIIGSVIDLTERKAIEQNLKTAQLELAHAARLTAMGGLLASIAHEIKQPLSAVVTNANAGIRWLDRDRLDRNEVRDALLRAADAGKRADAIIDSIRAMTIKSEPKLAVVDITLIVDEILVLLGSELQRYEVEAKTNFGTETTSIYCDKIQLQQVLLNVVMNSLEAMSSIVDRPRLLEISGQLVEQNSLLIQVADTGVGVDLEMAERMFEPFCTTKPNGMGIGLSICRDIIDAHGGRMWASPRAPHGTVLYFTVPTTSPVNVLS